MLFERSFKVLMLLFMLAGLLLLVACGEDDDDIITPNDFDAAELLVDQANDQLEDILFDEINGGEPQGPEDVDMTLAYNLYLQAIEKDEDHPQANFGAGLLELVMITRDAEFQQFFDDMNELMEWDGYYEVESGPDAHNGGINLSSPLMSITETVIPVMSPVKFVTNVASLDETGMVKISEMQDMLINEVLPRIESAISYLDIVTIYDDFAFYITPKMQGDTEADAIEIDLTEVYAALTALNVAAAELNWISAYSFDVGDYTGDDLFDALQPGSDFLALRTNGANYMSSALAHLVKALNDFEDGIDYLENEVDSQYDDLIKLDPYDGVAQADLDTIKSHIPQLRDALTSEVTINYDTDGDGIANESITLSLYNFMSDPVEDLKTLIPAYSLEMVESPDIEEYWEGFLMYDQITVTEHDYYFQNVTIFAEYGEIVSEDGGSNIDIPGFDQVIQDFIAEHADAEYLQIVYHFYAELDAGTHDVQVYVSTYREKTVMRSTPRLTWTADSYEEWVFPDPTMGGIMPNMTDSKLKEMMDINGEYWEKVITFEW